MINIEEWIGPSLGRSQKLSPLACDEAALASVWLDVAHVFSIHNEVLQNAALDPYLSPGSPATCINNGAIAKPLQWKTLPPARCQNEVSEHYSFLSVFPLFCCGCGCSTHCCILTPFYENSQRAKCKLWQMSFSHDGGQCLVCLIIWHTH